MEIKERLQKFLGRMEYVLHCRHDLAAHTLVPKNPHIGRRELRRFGLDYKLGARMHARARIGL